MRAAGSARFFLFVLVISEVVFITLVGATAGLVFAALFDSKVSSFFNDSFGQTRSILQHDAIAQGFIVMLLAGLLAGIVPAIKAARVDVMKAIEP
jgi:putative ABC transport system permease protein